MANTNSLPLTASDGVCADDVDALGSETTSDLQSLEQDVYHILIELPGTNPDDLNRGIGIEQILSAPTTELVHICRTIESQLEKDSRIDSVEATLLSLAAGAYFADGTIVPEGGGYSLEIQIVAGPDVLGLNYAYASTTGLVPQ